MADTVTQEQRRKNMQAIRSRSKLENKVSRALWNKRIRFRKNYSILFGNPDITYSRFHSQKI